METLWQTAHLWGQGRILDRAEPCLVPPPWGWGGTGGAALVSQGSSASSERIEDVMCLYPFPVSLSSLAPPVSLSLVLKGVLRNCTVENTGWDYAL